MIIKVSEVYKTAMNEQMNIASENIS